ncbi:MAG: immune inhibitor A [Polyangiaceae bacterium]|nr:immune inhibitor A [Polyangiaceae bacterium]
MERWIFRRWIRSGAAALSLCLVALTIGCASEVDSPSDTTSGSGGSGASGGAGGSGEGGAGGSGGSGACAQDCSIIDTPPCLKAVCNTGEYPGEIGTCVVIDDDGASCDDGEFCTTNDTCQGGQCMGGPQNDCGMAPAQCEQVVCNEASDTCSVTPAANGAACTSSNLCEINAVCQNGLCAGTPKDCFFSPLNECNTVACNPANGLCEPTPDPAKDGAACQLTGDPCQVNKTCSAGACQGGVPKDCSAMTAGCTNGVCEASTGNCIAEPIPPGGMCLEATDGCNTGICDPNGTCMPVPVADGTACNDYNSCTGGDVCTAGTCAGAPVGGCTFYFEDNFENGCPPGGWTLGGDWQCGTPSGAGPGGCHAGTYCIGTVMTGNYNNSQSFGVAIAQTPPIGLGGATEPILSFYAWVYAESSFDGVNLKVSTNGGATFSLITGVSPAYNGTAGGEEVWTGTAFNSGWQMFTVNLAAYVGQSIILRWDFRSDGSVVYPGAYIDDIVVSEANAIPLSITTSSPLPGALVNNPYSVQLQKSGGSSSPVWSITGGVNHQWLSIDPATGLLSGTPAAGNLGPFSVDVHVEEASLPTNFADKTLTGTVVQGVWAQNFEGACPNGWALGGDWQCGVPSGVGPATAYDGSQCLGTIINGNYNNSQSYAVATATSPAIDLTGAVSPTLTFRMWVDTEGSVFDGANLKISTDGVSFTQMMNVVPAYTLTVAGEQAWGGHMSAQGWQLVTVDLAAYAGQTIYLRYAWATDSSVVYPGVYIDSLVITD